MLGQIRQDEVGRDRRHLVEPGLAELALDVVLDGEAEAAVGVEARIARCPRRLGGYHLGQIGLRAAWLAGVEQCRPLLAHQVGSGQGRIGAGQWELHTLVGADRATEHLALVGIRDGTVEEAGR